MLKLSGEVFGGGKVGVDPDVVAGLAKQIAIVVQMGVQVAVVVGGGNFFRGAELQQHGMERDRADYMVIRERRTASVWAHVPHGDPVDVWIELETGGTSDQLPQLENWTPPQRIDDGWVGEASFEIPADLPLGYHTLRATSGARQASMPLIITPQWVGSPERMGQRRGWGFATQLYSVRSQQSWGVGDLTDLEDLSVWSAAQHEADFILVNPLHGQHRLDRYPGLGGRRRAS